MHLANLPTLEGWGQSRESAEGGCSGLVDPGSSAAKGQSSTTWALQPLDLIGQFSPNRALSAAMAVQEWVSQLLD